MHTSAVNLRSIFIVMKPWIYSIKRLVVSKSIGRWCQLPYIDHSQGCPNYRKAKKCPPRAMRVGEYFDLSHPLFFVHSEFNLATHIAKMEQLHPEWTLKQCKCVLYWQPVSRKQLRHRIKEASELLGTNATTDIPEAMGINVYVTARIAGLKLERIRHLSICKHVALIGTRIGTKIKEQIKLF